MPICRKQTWVVFFFTCEPAPLVPFDLTAKEVVDTVEVGGRSFDANRPQLGAILFPGKGKPAGWDKRPMNAAGGFLQNNSRIGALTESYG
ncbi:hypothetical protein CDAR_246971 [Caerostris darwini]|uniref:Uncharacterized protein n=1 Tax=Caerostris darwini TaxID=1538125 RepID=A0AAV4WWL4_9ARAC|nr:hypothetical protein CDAR_246971 [Caerostris darwini]